MRAFKITMAAMLLGLASLTSFQYYEYTTSRIPGTIFSLEDITEIYAKISINSGHIGSPPLNVLDSPELNAWTDGSSVVITTSMLSVLHNNDELAMILGHELAHAINQDPTRNDGMVLPQDVEAHADKLGAFIMMKAGFDVCKGKEVFETFKELYGDTAAPESHPSFAYRIDQLTLPQCD